MKRLISSLLVICLFISLLPSSVFAIFDNLPTMPPLEQHEEPFVPSEIGTVQPEPINDNTASNTLMQEIFGANKENEEKQESPIPDDVWEGTFKDYPCKDGTVTRVYNNNSIYTMYPDGSKEGVDYKGNRYTKDSSGKTVCYATDGNQYIQNADGSEEAIATNGTHFYYNEDGTSKGVTTDGFVFEYDAKGNTSAIGIDGGERLSLIDKKGDYITGEHVITGPDGRKFTMVNNENKDGDVTQFKMWFETKDEAHGVDLNMNSDDASIALSIKDAEGNDVSMSMSEKQNGDGSAISSILMDIKNKDGTWLNITGKGVTDKDGCTDFTLEGSNEKSKFMSVNAKSDADGNLTSMTGNFKTDDGEDVTFSMTEDEMSLTSSSGLFMKANQSGVEFYDAKSGDHIKINDKGEPEIFHVTDEDGSTVDYKDGKFTTTDKDGKKSSITIVKDEKTGTVTVTTSEGDTYSVTKDGKVLKNGKELTKDEATPSPKDGFPFDKYSFEKNNFSIDARAIEGNNTRVMFDKGLADELIFMFKGHVPGKEDALWRKVEYEKDAHYEYRNPEIYLTSLTNKYVDERDGYPTEINEDVAIYERSERGTWASENYESSTLYIISQKFTADAHRYYLEDDTAMQAMQKKVQSLQDKATMENYNNFVSDPFTKKIESDGFSVICHWGDIDFYAEPDLSVKYSQRFSNNWIYCRIFTLPEMPGYYFYITLEVKITLEYDPYGLKFSGFVPHIESTYARIREYLDMKVGEKIMEDYLKNYSFRWE